MNEVYDADEYYDEKHEYKKQNDDDYDEEYAEEEPEYRDTIKYTAPEETRL